MIQYFKLKVLYFILTNKEFREYICVLRKHTQRQFILSV